MFYIPLSTNQNVERTFLLMLIIYIYIKCIFKRKIVVAFPIEMYVNFDPFHIKEIQFLNKNVFFVVVEVVLFIKAFIM